MESIRIKDEFIKLGQALKLAGLVDSGLEAKEVIQDGRVSVNGETDTRRGRKLYPGDTFSFEGKTVVVEHFEYLHTEACFVVHHSLFDIDSAEALLACDTCNSMVEALLAEVVIVADDHSTCVLGSIGISDIYWDTC